MLETAIIRVCDFDACKYGLKAKPSQNDNLRVSFKYVSVFD